VGEFNLGFWAVVHVVLLRRGGTLCAFCVNWSKFIGVGLLGMREEWGCLLRLWMRGEGFAIVKDN
jgi:hypothetical protein